MKRPVLAIAAAAAVIAAGGGFIGVRGYLHSIATSGAPVAMAAAQGSGIGPRMIDYVVPSGVRIADADRVRLGAHLASGTTVMHEGFVNFNAGTLGTSMVEGRIVAGVVVGDGSDVGGGASILGTLSGGGKDVVSIGRRCLLGANSGVGISLGDDCYRQARARGARHPHAVRIVARGWIRVIWACWHTDAIYDPARHTAEARHAA